MSRRSALVFVLAVHVLSCSASGPMAPDKKTDWLRVCHESSDCRGGLECIHGLCTLLCSDDTSCHELAKDATCVNEACGRKTRETDAGAPSAVDAGADATSPMSVPDAGRVTPVTTATDASGNEPRDEAARAFQTDASRCGWHDRSGERLSEGMTMVKRAYFGTVLMLAALACSGSAGSDSSSSSKRGISYVKKRLAACLMKENPMAVVHCMGVDEYNACIESKCAPAFKKCYGDSYQSGIYSELCGPFLHCVTDAKDPCTGICQQSYECSDCELTEIDTCARMADSECPQLICPSTGSAGSAAKP